MQQGTRRLFTAGAVLMAACLLFLLIVKMKAILIPFVLAIVAAYILLPPVEALVKRKVPVTLAIFLVYFTVGGAVAVLIFYVFPGIFSELNRFIDHLPAYTGHVQRWVQGWQHDYSRFNLPDSIRQVIDETMISCELKIIEMVRSGAGILMGLFSYSFTLILVPFLTYYFLKDHEIMMKKIVSLLPPKYREELLNLWALINVVLRKFIYGHFTVALIVGILTGSGLALIGIDYAVTLGFIAGVADIIPYFGPIIGAVPAVALALLQSKRLALYTILVMFLVQQLESAVISPKIISDSVGLHPLVIILVLFLGGYLWGVVGMLVAVPATVVLRILVNYLYQKAVSYRTN